jgi:FLVCR family MFS transporter
LIFFFICFQVTSLICAALNGWASIVIDGTLTALTAAWFPAGERTTATGLIVALQMAGLVPPSLLFPWLVPEPPPPSSQNNINRITAVAESSQLAADIRDEVAVILYGEAALAAALLVVMLFFFPDRPPSPPSKSAGSARQNVRSSLRDIFRKPKCVAAGASTNTHTSGLTLK